MSLTIPLERTSQLTLQEQIYRFIRDQLLREWLGLARLVKAQVAGTGGPVRRTGSAEDVGDLDGGAHAHSPARRSRFPGSHRQPVERAGHVTQHSGGDLRVISSGLQLGMTEQRLDDADVDPVLEQVGGEAVPQRVRPDALADVRSLSASTTTR